MVNSRQKGKRAEREAAHFLTDMGFSASRGQQYKGGSDSADVVLNHILNDYIHIEVKMQESLNVEKALQQAIRDSASKKLPIVMHRKKREEWKITLQAHQFWKLIQKLLHESPTMDWLQALIYTSPPDPTKD